MSPTQMWKCPKCGRALTSGGESIAQALGPLASALPDLAAMTDIKCACGTVIPASQLVDRKQSSETPKQTPSAVEHPAGVTRKWWQFWK